MQVFALTIDDRALNYGPSVIPFSSVVACGVGVTPVRRVGVEPRKLLVAYRNPGESKMRLISHDLAGRAVGLDAALAAALRDKWMGEDYYFAMRKRLGFSSSHVFLLIAAVVVVSIVVIVGLAMMNKRSHGAAPRTAKTTQR